MEDKSVQNFALGIIVAIVVFLLLRKEFGKHAATSESGIGGGDNYGGGAGGCGCGTAASNNRQPIPIGGQSLAKSTSYGGSSVTSNVRQMNAPAPRIANLTAYSGGGSGGVSASGGGTLSQGTGTGYASIGSGWAGGFL